jgi:hypothetical protein
MWWLCAQAGVFGGSLFSAMHGSLVTSSLIRETTENESANEGYKFAETMRKSFAVFLVIVGIYMFLKK